MKTSDRPLPRAMLLCALAVFCGLMSARGLAAGEAGSSRLSELPVNTWTKLSEFPRKQGYLVPMVWLPEQKRGFVWGALHCGSSLATLEEWLQHHLFDPQAGKWETRASTFPAEGNVKIGGNNPGRPYVYLPGLKRMLLLAEASGGLKTGTSCCIPPAPRGNLCPA